MSAKPTKKTVSLRKKILICFVWILLLEIMLRVFLPLPIFNTSKIEVLKAFYPEFKKIKRRKISKDDRYFDILMLGGSVLYKEYPIDRLIHEKLSYQTKKLFRVHNAAEHAHTSLDSYYKYKNLMDKNFDLVLLYHGINETRTNNCPSSIFKNDYSHYSWYRAINQLDNHKEIAFTVIPYTFHFLLIYGQEHFGSSKLIPFKKTIKEWVHYGNEIKTKVPFRNNIIKILEIAHQKNEKVVLMTFAYYIPENYTKENFLNKKLGYTIHQHAIHVWGKPEYVEKGIKVHNAIVKDIASNNDQVIFIDQEQLIPKEGKYFRDICHFTVAGCEVYVNNLIAKLESESLKIVDK